MKKNQVWVRAAGLCLLLLLIMIFAISVGSADLSMWDSLQLVLAKIPGIGNLFDVSELGDTYEMIVWNVRMP